MAKESNTFGVDYDGADDAFVGVDSFQGIFDFGSLKVDKIIGY